MRLRAAWLCACVVFLSISTASHAHDCPDKHGALGTARILEVDTSKGPLFGRLQYKTTLPLERKEVVLTFDDGPHERYTEQILAILDAECVRATFFPVGFRSVMFPHILRAMVEGGHTIGNHTWSHPGNLARLSKSAAIRQVERGFRALQTATGEAPAPFLRFPGLNHSSVLRHYAAKRGYAIFSTDIGTDDWRGIGPKRIIHGTMRRLRQRGSGIILFHDIKRATVQAMPGFLRQLKSEGYRIVHIVPKPGGHWVEKPALAATSRESRQGRESKARRN